MGKIFCIMGKSSTGKDTLYQRLLDREDLKLQQIVSYTTRPIRAGEIDGIEYHFCTQKEKGALLAEGKVVEIRSYHTCFLLIINMIYYSKHVFPIKFILFILALLRNKRFTPLVI